MNTFKKRIDELGRIVIPKEIRNNIKINNFDELEMYIQDNQIILKKTSRIDCYKDKFKNLLDLISNIYNFKVFIFSIDKLIINNYGDIDVTFDNIYQKLVGNIHKEDIIIDSNLLGHIIFINNDIKDYTEKYKLIKNIIIDIIN